MKGFRWLAVAVRPHSVSRVAAQRAVLLQLFVVDVFFALEIRSFGSGGNPFAQRLDYLGVEAFRGLGDAAVPARLPPRVKVCIRLKELSCPL